MPRRFHREARALLAQTAERERVVFFNKADVGEAGARAAAIPDAISGSVYEAGTIRALRSRTRARRMGRRSAGSRAAAPRIAARIRGGHDGVHALEAARATLREDAPIDLIVGDLQEAYAALGHVTGDVAAEDVLSGVFSRFCIGK